MRRFTGLLAFVAILLMTRAPARADQTYTAQVPFQANSLSMWKNGANGMSQAVPLTTSWNDPFDASASTKVAVLGHFSVGASGGFAGSAGLTLTQYANGGTVAVVYPLTLTLTYPDQATLAPGQTFTLRSSWVPGVPGVAPYLSTKSPSFGLAADAGLNISEAWLHLGLRAFGDWFINDDIFNTSFDINQRLFDTAWLGNGTTNLFNGELTVKVKQPTLNTSGYASGGATGIQTSASSDFLSFGGNFTNALVAETNIPHFPKLADSESHSFEGAGISWNYRCLTLEGNLPVNVAQQFQFTPRPKLSLNLSTGQSVPLTAGDSVQLTMPSDGSALKITPVMTLDNQFSNRMQVQIGGGISGFVPNGLTFYPFSFHGRVGWGTGSKTLDYSLPALSLVDLGQVYTASVYDQTFPLGGFTPRTLSDIVIAPVAPPPPPPPPTLTPTDDSYIGFSAGGNSGIPVYEVLAGYNSTVPGVLDNDTGSVPFTAVPQDIEDPIDPNHYFRLDSLGNLDFSIPQSDVPQDTQFQFPYQITDGQGHFATGNIYIAAGPNGGG
jgi:hypothetical protein